MRDARAVMHVGIANPQLRGKRSRHSRRMRNPQFYVSGKRPIAEKRCNYVRTEFYIRSAGELANDLLLVIWEFAETKCQILALRIFRNGL